MKIYIKRSISGSVNVNPNVANSNFSPESVLQCIANHPINNALNNPVMADYIGLGASGGVNFASPQPGIKLARNGAWIPLKVNYFRTTLASRSGYRFDDGMAPSYYRSIDASVRDVTQGAPGTPNIGGNKLKPAPIPTGPPYTLAGFTGVRDGIYPSKLNVSPGASQNVQYENAEQYSLAQWPSVISNNGFPGASGYLANTFAVEGVYSVNSMYNKTELLADTLVASVNGTTSSLSYQASACEYLELDIDDTLVANIASLTNDVFIIVPIALSSIFNYAATYAPLGGPTEYLVTGNQADSLGNETLSYLERVIPLSFLINQLNSAPNYTVGNTGNVTANLLTDAVGNYDLVWQLLATLAFVPQTEITLPLPSYGGQIGPY